MIKFYILPIERNGDDRGPKYFSWKRDPNPPGIGSDWSMVDYGSVDMATLITDIQQSDHDNLILNSDVYSFPDNLDASMNQSQRTTLNNYLEANGLPGDWITSGTTFRVALRTVTSMMLYFQRVCAIMGYPSDPFNGITLNTQYRNLPSPLSGALQQATSELGYVWNVGNNDAVRKILKNMSDQWGSKTIYFGLADL